MLNARQQQFQEQQNRLDHIKYLSAPVGSGKTAAIIHDICQQPDEYNIFVAPTIRLCEEIHERLLVELQDQGQNERHDLFLVTTDNAHDLRVIDRALEVIRENHQNSHTLIVTTNAFKDLITAIFPIYKAKYNIFIDEGVEAITYDDIIAPNPDLFIEPLSMEEDGSLSVGRGQQDMLQAVVRGNAAQFGRDDLCITKYQNILTMLLSDIYDVYGEVTNQKFRVIAFLRPDAFLEFKSITILMAIFEHSLLFMFWREKYNIEFQEYHSEFALFDTHHHVGPRIRIHHLLAYGDNATRTNLEKDWTTPQQKARHNSGLRVIDRMAEIIRDEIAGAGEDYCWAASNPVIPRRHQHLNEHKVPPISAGLNAFKDFDTFISLLTNNPPPWVDTMVRKKVELGDINLFKIWSFGHTYQAIGRCSIRDRNSKRPIHLVVLSHDCATRIANLFQGTAIEGQLGDLPSLAQQRRGRGLARREAYAPRENKAWSRFTNDNPDTHFTKEQWVAEVYRPRYEERQRVK